MKENLAPFLLLILISSCKKEIKPIPDIVTGLVVNISLDGNALEAVTGTTGIIHNATSTTNRHGEAGKALHFSRTDSANIDFGDLANASFPSNQFTISCWVLVSDTSHSISVLSKRGETGPFEYSLDNHFAHAVFNLDNWPDNGGGSVYGMDPLKASSAIQLNVWQHIAYVADSSSLNVYLNGVLQNGTDQRVLTLTLSHSNAHFVIGNGGGWGSKYFFDGSVDDIRMYNKVLEASTIQYLSIL